VGDVKLKGLLQRCTHLSMIFLPDSIHFLVAFPHYLRDAKLPFFTGGPTEREFYQM
jgi:hypothetical protein